MSVEPRWRKPLLTLHVAASVSLIGTDLVLVLLGAWGVSGASAKSVFPAAYLVQAWLVAPLILIALGTGVLQGVLSSWGLVRYWWTTIKLAITALFTILIFAVLLPRLSHNADAANAGQAFSTAQFMTIVIVPAIAVALLVVNVALGLVKPRARLGRAESADDAPARPSARTTA